TCNFGPPCSREPQIVWDVSSGNRLQQPRHHDNVVIAAAISPNGELAATGGGDNNEIRVWTLATGAPVTEPKRKPVVLAGTGAATWAVAFSVDGERIAWGTIPRYGAQNDRGPLGFQFRLPNKTRGLGHPEPMNANDAKGFVRAHATGGTYSLTHRKGSNYGY